MTWKWCQSSPSSEVESGSSFLAFLDVVRLAMNARSALDHLSVVHELGHLQDQGCYSEVVLRILQQSERNSSPSFGRPASWCRGSRHALANHPDSSLQVHSPGLNTHLVQGGREDVDSGHDLPSLLPICREIEVDSLVAGLLAGHSPRIRRCSPCRSPRG